MKKFLLLSLLPFSFVWSARAEEQAVPTNDSSAMQEESVPGNVDDSWVYYRRGYYGGGYWRGGYHGGYGYNRCYTRCGYYGGYYGAGRVCRRYCYRPGWGWGWYNVNQPEQMSTPMNAEER